MLFYYCLLLRFILQKISKLFKIRIYFQSDQNFATGYSRFELAVVFQVFSINYHELLG